MLKRFGVLCTFAVCATAMADITVSLDPMATVIANPGGTMTANIVADIPQSDAVLGWGIDLTLTNPGVAGWTVQSIGASFDPFFTQDGDGLAGLVRPGAEGVWGMGVVLATVEFTGLMPGVTPAVLGDSNPQDLTEGFAMDPSGFANVLYTTGTVTVLPEPASLCLLTIVGLAMLRRR